MSWKCANCGWETRATVAYPIHCRCGCIDYGSTPVRRDIETAKRRRASTTALDVFIRDNCEPCDHWPCLAKKACQHRDALYFGAECPRGLPRPGRKPPVKRLAVVTCFFNPQHYHRPRENYERFAAGIRRVCELCTVELAYDDDEFDLPDAAVRVRGTRANNLMWQKERLLNLGIRSLPADVDGVAWVDADCLFERDEWYAETCAALAHYDVLQPFELAQHLSPTGDPTNHLRSVGWYYQHSPAQHSNLLIAHPGFAWAARREWLDKHGLYEHMITGGGDSLMVAGFTKAKMHVFEAIKNDWLSHVWRWANAVYADVGGRLGYVPGTLRHLYHGDLQNRLYIRRWNYLTSNNYDPATDITIDETGLLAWTDFARQHKAHMIDLVSGYFAQRKEDE